MNNLYQSFYNRLLDFIINSNEHIIPPEEKKLGYYECNNRAHSTPYPTDGLQATCLRASTLRGYCPPVTIFFLYILQCYRIFVNIPLKGKFRRIWLPCPSKRTRETVLRNRLFGNLKGTLRQKRAGGRNVDSHIRIGPSQIKAGRNSRGFLEHP